MSDQARAAVLAVARSWIGTSFHHGARVKGVGVDCAQFVAAVFEEAGVVPHVETEAYSAQFMLHSREEKMLGYVLARGREIPEAEARPADVVLYRVGKSYSHAGIIVDWPRAIIHAHLQSRAVIEMDGRAADLSGRTTRFFTPW